MTTPKAKLAGFALIVALCTGFTLGLTAPAWAGFEEGEAAYNRGDYATAIREFRPLAEQGDAYAQFNVGLMYSEGEGEGVPQDYAKAVKWFRKAAEQGVAEAQYNLGHMYNNGQGVPQDYAKAAKWYSKAAGQEHAGAQVSLGRMYGAGLGVPQDYVRAYAWYDLAASRFSGFDRAVEYRNLVAAEMPPAQIAEAKKLAREWKEKHQSGEAQTVAVYRPPEPEGDGTPRCLTGATFGPIAEDSPLFGGVIRIQVVGVERDSLAWKKGLREHDAVVMVNGELVRDLDEFAAATRKRGGSLILKVLSRSFTRAWWYIGSGFFSVVC